MPRAARALAALGCAAAVPVCLALPAAGGATAPDDPAFEQGLQWGLERIGAPAAWAHSTGAGVTIAVVDSGVDLEHEDLRDKVVDHVSCIGSDGRVSACRGSGQDDSGHGTHVAGIALATTDNQRGIAGVAPDAELLAVRVLADHCDADGECSAAGAADDVAAGIRWAAEQGADVINLSLGGGLEGATGCPICSALDDAWAQGAIPVIAAGNDSELPAGFADEHAVVVTATTRADGRASYSGTRSGISQAARWAVSAPGGETETDPDDCATGRDPKGVLSAYWVAGERNEYACQAGTSMAAPHVAGALAVLLGEGHSPQAAIDRLLATAEDIGRPGRDDQFGEGLVDLGRAAGSAPTDTTSTTDGVDTSDTEPTTPDGSTTVPVVTLPGPLEAARFDADPTPSDDRPPRGVVVAAAGAALAAAVAWHRRSR